MLGTSSADILSPSFQYTEKMRKTARAFSPILGTAVNQLVLILPGTNTEVERGWVGGGGVCVKCTSNGNVSLSMVASTYRVLFLLAHVILFSIMRCHAMS